MSDEVPASLELQGNATEEASVETVCFERVLGDIEGSDAVEDLEYGLCRDAELVDVPHEAKTFWIPADVQPSTTLEGIAKSIFDFHMANRCSSLPAMLSDLPLEGQSSKDAVDIQNATVGVACARGDEWGKASSCDNSCTGAEWWIQIREGGHHIDLGMPFHWDKDERLLEQVGVMNCPMVSTVTYLTDHGAPTVVLESCATARGRVLEGELNRAFVSYPSRFKHLAFDGRFLHGVPAILARAGEAGRRAKRLKQAMQKSEVCVRRHPGSPATVSSSVVDGSRLAHGDAAGNAYAVGKQPRERGKMRVTLLVNVWLSHKPVGIAPLPHAIAETLSEGTGFRGLDFSHKVNFSPVNLPLESTGGDGRANSGSGGGSCDRNSGVGNDAAPTTVEIKAALSATTFIEMCIPTPEALSTGTRPDLHAFLIQFKNGCHARVSSSNGGSSNSAEALPNDPGGTHSSPVNERLHTK